MLAKILDNWLVLVIINLVVGGWSIAEILSWFGKSIPFIFDIIIGLILAEISVPVAIVGWILRICGVF